MKKMLLLMVLVLSLTACKKKIDHDQEIQRKQASQASEDAAVWKITTPGATYTGHKVEIYNNVNMISFVTDEGKKVYCTGTFQAEVQAR